VLQPVIQLGTAIHGQGFSGGAMNGVQKPWFAQKILSVQRRSTWVKDCFYTIGF
jgi:hypothetical protein